MEPETMLDGRWALVLGASSGFGAATARALAQAGMNIFEQLCDVDRFVLEGQLTGLNQGEGLQIIHQAREGASLI